MVKENTPKEKDLMDSLMPMIENCLQVDMESNFELTEEDKKQIEDTMDSKLEQTLEAKVKEIMEKNTEKELTAQVMKQVKMMKEELMSSEIRTYIDQSVAGYMSTNIRTLLESSVQEFLENKLVVFQDDVKYNQITTAVGQYLANSDVITNAIKGHLVNQDKTTQKQKDVPQEVNTLLRNMVPNKTNKQWQAKFGTSTSIIEKDLANMER